MSASVVQLIRHAPLFLLKEYFSLFPASIKIDCQSNYKQVLEPLLQIIDDLWTHDKKRIVYDAERILNITDETGKDHLKD